MSEILNERAIAVLREIAGSAQHLEVNFMPATQEDAEEVEVCCELGARAIESVDQLRVQLAGIFVAAEAGEPSKQHAKQGDYGWSPAYERVRQLRREYEAMRELVRRAVDVIHASKYVYEDDGNYGSRNNCAKWLEDARTAIVDL